MTRPVWMILIGFVMVLVGGILVPFLMLPGVGILPLDRLSIALAWILPIFFYCVSVAGLFLGIIGSAMYIRLHTGTSPRQNSSSGRATSSRIFQARVAKQHFQNGPGQ